MKNVTNKKFYVYLHCLPNCIPFYVGKGSNNRAYTMCQRSDKHKEIVNKYGKENIKVYVFFCESENDAYENEIHLISQLKNEGYVLLNLTSGGGGVYNLDIESRKRKSNSMKITLSLPDAKNKNNENLKKLRENNDIQLKRKQSMINSWRDEEKKKIRIDKMFSKENREHHKQRMASIDVKKRHIDGIKKTNQLESTRINKIISQRKRWGTKIICIEANICFVTLNSSVKWLIEQGYKKASTGGVTEALKNDKFVRYGYHWKRII